jgi:hypothetical protein
MQRELPKGPPIGWRKAIPVLVKLKVVVRQDSRCTTCGERLGQVEDTEFDHIPALQLRIWCDETKDTIPPANDESSIFAKHSDCHAVKTFGTKTTKRGADVTEIARTKRIAKETEEFRRRMLAKGDPDAPSEEVRKPKKKWPSRPFPKKGSHGSSHQGREEGG